ncbi:DUF6293 family protein [Halorientalis sp.]|uniref:HFX_2341 family transcriptional regulator domain-containing protein n=1 Tax=Halorientalis sp. TaxID=1931229 RepID=UPI002610E0BA|nr:DUF6293 family protein [Halorientalis sp.]
MREIREIHIAPLGYEHDRILEPIRTYDADEVYLLAAENAADHASYHEALIEQLEGQGVDVTRRSVDLDDVYAVLGIVTTIAADHDDDIVRVNVASGAKLADIGCAIACMATDATAYYVHPESHVPPLEREPLTEGVADVEVLPSYPVETPTTDQVAILDHIQRITTEAYTPKKSDLIEFSEAEQLSYMTEADPANDKAKFALLNANIIEPLVERSYVRVESVGRQKQTTLTETGENALKAFRHKLQERDSES